MRYLIALIALISVVAHGQEPAHADTRPPVTWIQCFNHTDQATATRVVSTDCHTNVIHRATSQPMGHWYRRWQQSPHVWTWVRYPTWVPPAPLLNPCIWPSVRRWAVPIATASRATGIPANTLAAQIQKESAGDPYVSSQGYGSADIGLMQFGSVEAAMVGGLYTYDPAGNIMTGALIDRYLLTYDARGNLFLALEQYNGGVSGYASGYGYAAQITAWAMC